MKKTLRVEKVSTRMRGLLAPLSLLLGMFLFSTHMQAQIETMYNMYRFNPQILTPVQAGSTPHSEVIFLHRNQWVGIEGAPRTYSLTGNIKWGEKKGIGLVGMVDEVGPMRATVLSGDFAYHTRLTDKWRLSGGIRLSAANVALNFSQLRLTNPNDILFQGDRSTGIQPNAGFGIRINKGDGFFASFAMPRLGKYNFGQYNGAFKDVNYIYANVGTRIKLGGDITTKQGDVVSRVTLYPSVMARVAVDVPISWDVNLQANLKGKLDLGVSYRREDSWGLRAGIQATKKYYLTYVYEKPISDLAKVTSQTHEFGVRMFIFKKDRPSSTSGTASLSEQSDYSGASESSRQSGQRKPVAEAIEAKPATTLSQSATKSVDAKPEITSTKPVVEALETPVAKIDVSSNTKSVTTPSNFTEPQRNTSDNNSSKSRDSSGSSGQSGQRKQVLETPEGTGAKSTEEEEWEYVTVTKTRIIRKLPKVVAKTTKSISTNKAVTNLKVDKATPTIKVTSTAKPKSNVQSKEKAAVKSVVKKETPVQVGQAVAEAPEVKVTRKRISNNIVETTVETRGGSEEQVGQSGNQKVTKRKRKDGTEETIYTTTEVVKKRKVVK